MCVRVKIKKLSPEAVIPVYQKEGDSGFDLVSVEKTLIPANGTAIVPTGLSVAVPEGFELQVRPRSGISLKTNLMIANAPGTVDSGYRGEVGVIVRNMSPLGIFLKKGTRIAQGVICPVAHAEFEEVDELPSSDRGSAGYGSTGV